MTRFYSELLKHFSFHKQQSYIVITNGYITVSAVLLKIDIDDSKTTDMTLNNTKQSITIFYSSACPDGYYGTNCSYECQPPDYGTLCKKKCECLISTCHFIHGCPLTTGR